MSYDWLYKLEVGKEIEPGWYKLKWRPIKNSAAGDGGTWNLWFERQKVERFLSSGWWGASTFLGFKIYKGGAHNGWGRSWERLDIEIGLLLFTINFWIKWNIHCHKDGPSDTAPMKPLNILM